MSSSLPYFGLNSKELKAFREKWKLSQARMAKWLGISARQYQRYEGGDEVIPRRIVQHVKALPQSPPPD